MSGQYSLSDVAAVDGTPIDPDTWGQIKQVASDLGKGFLKGAGQTVRTLSAFSPMASPAQMAQVGVDSAVGPPPQITPTNTAQKIGSGVEQATEMLLTGGSLRKAATAGASKLPSFLQRVAAPAARIAAESANAAGNAALHGEDPKTAAMLGAGGGVIGEGLQAAAPALAEAAVSPGKRLLKSVPEGVDIGRTVLNETTGIRPKTITRQLQSKIADASGAKSQVLSDARRAGTTIPLSQPRQIVADEMNSAVAKNSPDYIKDVGKVADQLRYEYGPDGKPIMHAVAPSTAQGAGFVPVQVPATPQMRPVPLPNAVDPVRAHQLTQGIDLSIGNWNPEAQSAIAPLQERVRGAIAGAVHSAVPETAPLDAAMTNLIPAKDAAWNTSFNPSITGSIFNRVGRPTGALIGAGLGAEEGYKHGGTPGAIAGGLAGLAIPELIASPTGKMITARTAAHSPETTRAIVGASLPAFLRPKPSQDDRQAEPQQQPSFSAGQQVWHGGNKYRVIGIKDGNAELEAID